MGAMICERGQPVPIILDDALVFAQEAVRKCEKVGPGGQVGLDRSRELLRDIIALKERSMGAGS